jgi:DNA repair photolyase
MIINTGCRTDIPAYYSEWFYNRIKEKYVMTRNPYYPDQVLRYKLTPDVVDVLSFCTKNPEPMLPGLDDINQFRQFWFVTITPYGKEIEPNVPEKTKVIQSLKNLSNKIGARAVGWRYDPIFITDKYTVDYHIKSFEKMAENLSGYVNQCVISFIDLYEKTKRNFRDVREVKSEEQELLAREFTRIGKKYSIVIRTCCENGDLQKYGIDVSGCMTKPVMEKAIGCTFNIPKSKKSTRSACDCLLGNDIGMYNTCGHACVYCYANYDRKTVLNNMKQHNPTSPFLIGGLREGDKVTEVKQVSYCDGQIELFD